MIILPLLQSSELQYVVRSRKTTCVTKKGQFHEQCAFVYDEGFWSLMVFVHLEYTVHLRKTITMMMIMRPTGDLNGSTIKSRFWFIGRFSDTIIYGQNISEN